MWSRLPDNDDFDYMGSQITISSTGPPGNDFLFFIKRFL